MSNAQSAAFEALKAVIKKVPIFGDIYVMALESIPTLVKWAKDLRDERERQIRSFGFR